jgi:hypothetical protein
VPGGDLVVGRGQLGADEVAPGGQHSQPPACTASVVMGSWRQSVNTHSGAPGLAMLVIHGIRFGLEGSQDRHARHRPPSSS